MLVVVVELLVVKDRDVLLVVSELPLESDPHAARANVATTTSAAVRLILPPGDSTEIPDSDDRGTRQRDGGHVSTPRTSVNPPGRDLCPRSLAG